jgi:alcohol dehydrogenase (cytochrome c)
MLDGTILVYDDRTLDKLWEVNVGAGFVAPPMTYAVNGRQYIAIASGIGPVGKAKIARSPELKSQGNATMLFVFGL